MSQSLTDKINIYITVDLKTVQSYFNTHDPSPIYKKQINQKFELYILNAVNSAKRYSAIFYKLNCLGAVNRQYAEPLMHAVKRHFANKKVIRSEEFNKFKRRNFILLAISSSIVIASQTLLPLFMPEHVAGIYNGLKNCLDVFSWVILWRPIYELVFEWNPFLKDILLYKKLSTAEVLIIEDKKNSETEPHLKLNSHSETAMSESLTLESLLSN